MKRHTTTTISNHLRKYRKERGLSQVDVAKILGFKGTGHISRLENGQCWPSSLNLLNLAALYGVSVDTLYADMIVPIRETMRDRAATVLNAKLERTRAEWGHTGRGQASSTDGGTI